MSLFSIKLMEYIYAIYKQTEFALLPVIKSEKRLWKTLVSTTAEKMREDFLRAKLKH